MFGDCKAVQEGLANHQVLNSKKVVLFGGSHGGFLVTHLAGQYPDDFQAVVARNAVTNMASLSTVSDISDWTFNQAGLNFVYHSPTPEELKTMFEKSPISQLKNVKAPVYLMIGKGDLRCHPSQGIEFYRNLKALDKNVDVNWYDDNHPLEHPVVKPNFLINSILFFKVILSD